MSDERLENAGTLSIRKKPMKDETKNNTYTLHTSAAMIASQSYEKFSSDLHAHNSHVYSR
jgi:hypothetical protein